MAEFQFSCPQCAQRIQCDIRYSGTQIDCPGCKKPVLVPPVPPAAAPPAPVKLPPLRNILAIAASVVLLAALVIGGWYGYSRIRIHKLPPGLMAHWSAQHRDDMVEQNVSIINGVVGKAFTFSPDSFPRGTYVGLQIPDRPEFILTNSLTIEGWVRPRGNGYIILCRGDHRPGLDPYILSMQGNHVLRFQICDSDNKAPFLEATLPYYLWTHVAATLDGDTGTMSLYTNGVVAAQIHTNIRPLGELLPDQSPGVGIGNLNDGGNNFPFVGDIDEISLYSRALTASEIRAFYLQNAARAGERAEPLPLQNPPLQPSR